MYWGLNAVAAVLATLLLSLFYDAAEIDGTAFAIGLVVLIALRVPLGMLANWLRNRGAGKG